MDKLGKSRSAVLAAGAAIALGMAAMLPGCADNGGSPAETQGGRLTTEDAPAPDATGPYTGAAATADMNGVEVASFLGVRMAKPAAWTARPPQSMMHHAMFEVPAAVDGGVPAEIVVFFFGPGQGGPIDDNIRRWESQFRSPEGGSVRADVRAIELPSLRVTLVELEGEYRGMGVAYVPNQRFITAIVDTPGDQRIFIRFVGGRETVNENRDSFIAMIEGMEWVGR